MTDETTRPTDPTVNISPKGADDAKPADGKMRTVRLDPSFCPPGSAALIAGTTYYVGPGSTLVVPAELSDEALRVDLGSMLIVTPKA